MEAGTRQRTEIHVVSDDQCLCGYAWRSMMKRTFFTLTLFNWEAPNLKVWSPSGGEPPHYEHFEQSLKEDNEMNRKIVKMCNQHRTAAARLLSAHLPGYQKFATRAMSAWLAVPKR